jgi:uncharacterized protein
MSQAVRDLRWVMESPSLITNGCSHISHNSHVDAADLERFLQAQTSHRVGHYFESLVHYWLKHVRCVNVVDDRVQIFEGKQTVGELDFLFEDEDGCLTHLETAVKFYFYLPSDNALGECFVGPNPADNFQCKTDRLFQHQLAISETYFPDVQRRIAIVKGRIFYHPALARPSELPPPMSDNHLQNTWLYRRDTNWFRECHPDSLFRVLPKPYWLADDEVNVGDESLLSANALLKRLDDDFTTFDRPRLVSVLRNSDDLCREVDRVFVVDDRWPKQTSLSQLGK